MATGAQMARGSAADLPAPRGRVAVAMSGGVDSSVAAALVLQQGHQVVGVHMKLHDLPDAERRNKACCSIDDALDARQVCARLGIPYYVLDYREQFRESVIDYFVSSYRAGRTPNPCVMCNRSLKNGALLEQIRQFGCDTLATGHYAQVLRHPQSGAYEIHRPLDRRKDQTYFLFGTPREELPHLMFPLAGLEKADARKIAEGLGLITWNKPDSQEVCFVPSDYRDYLKKRLASDSPMPGEMVDRSGTVVGTHMGLPYYTVGQRRGLGTGGGGPLYVLELCPETNRIVVGSEAELYCDGMRVSGLNWASIAPPTGAIEAEVKVRYAHAGTRARIHPQPGAGKGGTARVEFMEPVRAVTPGQAAVFYRGDLLLGGGWIEPLDSDSAG